MTRSKTLASLADSLRRAIMLCILGLAATTFLAFAIVTKKLSSAEPTSAAIASLFLLFAMAYCLKARFALCRFASESPHPVGHCQDCGYDLSGQRSSGRCPECGSNYIIRQPQ